MKDEIKIGSLFSGVGGIEIGLHNIGGFKTEWFVENEPYAREILKKRFPDTNIYGDITELDFRKVPGIDILTGGFPCQDISNAGKRAGIKGSRSGLWSYYLEAIRVLRPKFTLIENVSVLINRGLDVVLSDLASVGYDAEWYNISASSVGAPHKRERVFIISYPKLCGCLHGQLKEQSTEARKYAQRDTCSSSTNVSDTYGQRLERKHKEKQGSRKSKMSPGWRGQWATEPKLGRVANGVPNRVDRIKCLGNAVVPQVAEIFAEAIKEKFV